MKYFLDLSGFNPVQLADLLSLARRLETQPDPQSLAGRIVTLLVMDRSFHTVSSFQAATSRLGGECIVLEPYGGLETDSDTPMTDRRHHAYEVLNALGSYSDVIGIRAHGPCNNLETDLRESLFRQFAKACPKPLINLGSALHHPCQGLADLKTLEDLDIPGRGGRFVLTWVNDAEARPLAAATTALQMAASRGMRVSILAPRGYELPQPLTAKARTTASEGGGSVIETNDRAVAMDAAHVVYGASWGCTSDYGNKEKDAGLRADLSDWCVTERWFSKAQETCQYMQTLPLRREISVSADVLEGPRSAVIKQAANRVPIQMAILHRMILGQA